MFISQKKHTKTLLKKFKTIGCKSITTPFVINEKLQKDDGAPEADTSCYIDNDCTGSIDIMKSTFD